MELQRAGERLEHAFRDAAHVAGADAIALAEQQVAQFQAEIDAFRDLSSSLALDEVETAAARS